MKYLIIGNSAAGLFAAEEIRRRDLESRIILLTSELYPSYSRCLTTYYLAGEISQSQLFIRSLESTSRQKFHIEYMAEVTQLNVAWKKVITRDGREWSYDKLLIATGASPVKLKVPGETLPQVYTLRTMEDTLRIEEMIEWGKRVVVIGGGLVSLKSAYALHQRGMKVTIVVSSSQILSQMLDSVSAQLLHNHLKEHGLKIILGATVTSILGREAVQGVELIDGRILWADFVIVGKGVEPNVQMLRSSGIQVKKGIVTNDFLETSFNDVFAAGDCAETWDRVREEYRVNSTWPNATIQGRIAGANMTGAQVHYKGSLSMNAVDFFGLSVISVGVISPPSKNSYSEEWSVKESLKYLPSGIPVYERLIGCNNILKGFVLVGDTQRAGILTRKVEEAKEAFCGLGGKRRVIF